MKDSDEGAVALLTIGLVTVVLMVLAGVSQGAHLFLAQRSLAGVCDGAATAAVQGLDTPELQSSGAVRVDLDEARRDLSTWLAKPTSTEDAPSATVDVTGLTADAGGVELTCHRHVTVPFSHVVGIGPTTLTAHAVARLPKP